LKGPFDGLFQFFFCCFAQILFGFFSFYLGFFRPFFCLFRGCFILLIQPWGIGYSLLAKNIIFFIKCQFVLGLPFFALSRARSARRPRDGQQWPLGQTKALKAPKGRADLRAAKQPGRRRRQAPKNNKKGATSLRYSA